jgi:hypothetical protein
MITTDKIIIINKTRVTPRNRLGNSGTAEDGETVGVGAGVAVGDNAGVAVCVGSDGAVGVGVTVTEAVTATA